MDSLILVEGRDDHQFIKSVGKNINLSFTEILRSNAEDGKNEPIKRSKISGTTLTSAGSFDKIKQLLNPILKENILKPLGKIAIICDADNKPSSDRFNEVVDYFKNFILNLPTKEQQFLGVPTEVGIFVFHGKDKKGAIEDFLLSYLEKNNDSLLKDCVEPFMLCASAKSTIKKESKAKLLAYFAGRKEDVTSIGSAAIEKLWDFNDPIFNDLKSFLQNLRIPK